MTAWEKHLMNYLFGAPLEKIFIVPNGVEEVFLSTPPVERGRVARLHRHHHRAQTRARTRAGRRPARKRRCGSSARPTPKPIPTRRFYALARQQPQLLRNRQPAAGRPRRAGQNLPRRARVRAVERHGNAQPRRRGGRRLRMPAAPERPAVGAQHVGTPRRIARDKIRRGHRRRPAEIL